MDDSAETTPERADTGGIDRRKAIGIGVAAGAAAWVAPAILSADAVAAASAPCDPCALLTVTISGCPNVPSLEIQVQTSAGIQSQFVQDPESGISRNFQGLCAGPATVRVLNDGVDICQSPQQVNLVCGQNNLTSACPC